MKRRALVVCGLLAACNAPNLDEYEKHTGIIRGTVFYPGGTARGNVIVLLFSTDRPPPPQGTSGPVNFVVVPKEKLFAGSPEGAPGDFTAPFTMPTVPPGRYTVRAFLDADGDFNPNPAYSALLGQATAGDVAGGYVDRATGAFIPIEVKADQVVEGSVLVTLARVLPTERPAFAFARGSTTTIQVPLRAPLPMVLISHPINRAQVKMEPAKTAFLVQFIDDDGDRVPDDQNGDHLPDVYPRVVLRRVATEMPARTIIIPAITNPLPYLDQLRAAGFATTTTIAVIIPPVAVEIAADGTRTVLNEIPTGRYTTNVILGTGQTWTVPNALDMQVPGGTDPTQSVFVEVVAGAPLPAGTISGTLRITGTDATGDAYVVAFDARNPPPPVGTGSPVALGTVPRAAFTAAMGGREAPFTVRGLPAGTYILRAILDANNSFSPLVSLLAQPDAGDAAGGAAAPVTLTEGGSVPGVQVVVNQVLPFSRPAFSFAETTIERTGGATSFRVDAHPIAALGQTAMNTRIPVALDAGDVNGDNLRDLLPRVLLTRMVDVGDPRTAPNDPAGIVIPAFVDPFPFLAPLAAGAPLVPAESLRVIVPPVAVRLGAGGMQTLVAPIPPGRYRVNLISPTGQTWSVPSDLDVVLGRVATPLADASQGAFIRVADTPVPMGAITGEITLAVPPPAGDFTVVVFAFDKRSPPPPVGSGRPVASALISKAAFAGGTTAPYALGGLRSGTYQVRAFLDADDDFTAWYDVLNQPDAGDAGGGHLVMGALADVDVDALGGPVTGKNVLIIPQLRYATDRPVFMLPSPGPVLSAAGGPVAVTITGVRASSEILSADGVFPIQWVDLNGDRDADDVNGDRAPDVFPLVVAELLDPNDPTGLTLAPERATIFGVVDPEQFAAAGFPATDTTATSSVTVVRQMTVAFPPIAVDASRRPIVPPPLGKYRVTLINARGQTWTTPNELIRATGDPLAGSQGRFLTVRE